MALNKDGLKQEIIKELNAKGFVTEGEFAKAGDMAEAIANAVVSHFMSSAEVTVTKGSSAGSYKVT
ncbi:hypothetical protein [Vibrio scophthalmi]|uniref:Uncharacterized protein n=1 Tax=Vibrio scophthalmi TaxID=45658 RepID=A0A1E3WJ20_9VIBR|nr:hypothetical protein [Vibrio scophthalmi]ODS09758.1 hypothetical protein VSF3289_03220 [Vibrio scophthalmi]